MASPPGPFVSWSEVSWKSSLIHLGWVENHQVVFGSGYPWRCLEGTGQVGVREGRDLQEQAVGNWLSSLDSLGGLVMGVACCCWLASKGVPSAPCPSVVHSEVGFGSGTCV